MHRFFRIFPMLLFGLTVGFSGYAQKRKIQNKPFIDTRRWHYGFNIGLHDQGFKVINNGYIQYAPSTMDPETGLMAGGEPTAQWMAENDRQNFGFSVGVLGSLKINNYFDLRINPGMNFGSKHIQYINLVNGDRESQDMKSTYIALPVDLKFGAKRFNNYRPYMLAGASAQFDLTATKHSLLRAKPFQTYLEVGLGCDIYMPFFKLIPELKFCFGLGNILQKNRKDITDPNQFIYTQSVDRATVNMVQLNLYFE